MDGETKLRTSGVGDALCHAIAGGVVEISVATDQASASMSWLQFIASIVQSLSWPLLLGFLAWLFKLQLIALGAKITSFEGFGFKLDFSKGVDELSENIEAAPPPLEQSGPGNGEPEQDDQQDDQNAAQRERRSHTQHPRGGGSLGIGFGSAEGRVLKSWVMIEDALREAAAAHISGPSNKPLELLADLTNEGILSRETAALIEEARHLRNAAAHGRTRDLTYASAQIYSSSALNIVDRIRREAGLR